MRRTVRAHATLALALLLGSCGAFDMNEADGLTDPVLTAAWPKREATNRDPSLKMPKCTGPMAFLQQAHGRQACAKTAQKDFYVRCVPAIWSFVSDKDPLEPEGKDGLRYICVPDFNYAPKSQKNWLNFHTLPPDERHYRLNVPVAQYRVAAAAWDHNLDDANGHLIENCIPVDCP